MLVKEMYHDCLYYEEFTLTYYLYHLLAEKKISLDDDVSKIDLEQADHQKVLMLIQNNVLGIHKTRIFSLKMNRKAFVFIYARSEDEAIQFYHQFFHRTPLNCHEYPLEFELNRESGNISFRDMKKEFRSFPAIAGYFTRRC
jgi:hypothetical protein